MQFTTTLSKFDSPLWGFHIKVPEQVSEHFLSLDNKRVRCSLNGTAPFPCALMPSGEGYYFININKELRETLRLQPGSPISVSLEKDDSKYGLPMPEEMEELLLQDPIGDQLFHALSPGKQRSLLYIVGKPKRPETRLKKALVVVGHLKANQGKIDYKRLNEDMKAANHI